MIKVNNTEIEEGAILKEMQYHDAGSHGEAKHKATEALVISELLQQEARKLGFDGQVDDFLDDLLENEIDLPQASEDVCQRYYENNRHKFFSSPLVEGRHILLAVSESNEKEREEARQMGDQLIRKLKGHPEHFSELASQYSRCPSAKTGGHLGQIGKGQTVPEFEEQLFRCEEGLHEKALESRYGIHVVWVDHIEAGRQLPFEAVKHKISEYLGDRLRFKAIAHYIQNLANQADIEGFELSDNNTPLMQ